MEYIDKLIREQEEAYEDKEPGLNIDLDDEELLENVTD